MTTESPDNALVTFRTIRSESEALLTTTVDQSEADTRANVIDRLLHEVLSWPRPNVRREQRIDQSYADYILTVDRPLLVLEAKRYGKYFEIPISGRRTLKISGSLWTDNTTREALRQAQAYCNDEGIPFAVVCNGHQWIAFRAIDPHRPWKDGTAVVFRSLDDIEGAFAKFWNTFSWDAIYRGMLDKELGERLEPRPSGTRPLDGLNNPDERFQRNLLHVQLYPLIQRVFSDIADDKDTLDACYVRERATQTVMKGLLTTIEDTVPHFAQHDDVADSDDKSFAREFRKIIDAGTIRPTTVILMGGVGAGKTTFLRRFFEHDGRGFVDTWCLWFTIEFTEAPPEGEVRDHVLAQLLEQLRARYPELAVDDWETYLKILKEDIARARRGVLGQASPDDADTELRAWIGEQVKDTPLLLSRLFAWAQRSRGKSIVITLDNLDQTGAEYQRKLFQLAHNLAHLFNCIVIVSLREETYFTGGLSGSFDAYHNKRFHIPSPDFAKVIRKRLDYGLRLLRLDASALKERLSTATDIDRQRVGTFLKIVQESFLGRNENILRCIRAIARGNTRRGLDMCTQFLISGYADVPKMLELWNTGGYVIGFHEFIKSWAMGERRFYREASSPAMNLFGLSESDNASHFTSHRILLYLLRNRARDSRIGKGFVPVQELTRMLVENFGDDVDVRSTLDKLLHWDLVESDNQQKHSWSATHVRASNAGEFYLRYLTRSFVYLDLVLMDTPIRNDGLVKSIVGSAYSSDLEVRLDRTSRFLRYLEQQESEELAGLGDREQRKWGVVARIKRRVLEREFAVIRQSARKGHARRQRRSARS